MNIVRTQKATCRHHHADSLHKPGIRGCFSQNSTLPLIGCHVPVTMLYGNLHVDYSCLCANHNWLDYTHYTNFSMPLLQCCKQQLTGNSVSCWSIITQYTHHGLPVHMVTAAASSVAISCLGLNKNHLFKNARVFQHDFHLLIPKQLFLINQYRKQCTTLHNSSNIASVV